MQSCRTEYFADIHIKIHNKLYDTLWLSKYLYPKRSKHGLEEWGETLGIAKPEVKDWSNLNLEEYMYRCQEDVNINCALYNRICNKLTKLYGNKIHRIQEYLSFHTSIYVLWHLQKISRIFEILFIASMVFNCKKMMKKNGQC